MVFSLGVASNSTASSYTCREPLISAFPVDIMDRKLSHDDVTGIVEELLDVQTKSKIFGHLLKIPRGSINSIHQQYSDPQDCLFHVIDEFVKQVEPKPTWRLILTALRNRLIGEYALAHDIMQSLLKKSSAHELEPGHKSRIPVEPKSCKPSTATSKTPQTIAAPAKKRASRPAVHKPVTSPSFQNPHSSGIQHLPTQTSHPSAKPCVKLELHSSAIDSHSKKKLLGTKIIQQTAVSSKSARVSKTDYRGTSRTSSVAVSPSPTFHEPRALSYSKQMAQLCLV